MAALARNGEALGGGAMCNCEFTGMGRGPGLDSLACLSGGLVHDFNNLLSVVIGSVEFLADALVERPELRQVACQALAAAEQGADLASRLLSLARDPGPKAERVDAWSVVQLLAPMLRRSMRRDIELSVEGDGEGCWVQADKAQLTAAVLNLCVNARDAMPAGGRIAVRVARLDGAAGAGPRVQISVEDTGEGIPPDVMSRIFEPFFTTKAEGVGTGLGLSMVRNFAREAGGTIEADSAAGAGARFTLSLPAADAAQGARPAKPSRPAPAPRVAVVEKAARAREQMAHWLAALGCEVRAFASSSEALAFLAAGEPCDLVLTDASAPGRKGRHFAACAWRYRPDLTILLMEDGATGLAAPRPAEHGRAARIRRPLRRGDLAQALDGLLARPPAETLLAS